MRQRMLDRFAQVKQWVHILMFWKTLRKYKSDTKSYIWRKLYWIRAVYLINKLKIKFKLRFLRYRPTIQQRYQIFMRYHIALRQAMAGNTLDAQCKACIAQFAVLANRKMIFERKAQETHELISNIQIKWREHRLCQFMRAETMSARWKLMIDPLASKCVQLYKVSKDHILNEIMHAVYYIDSSFRARVIELYKAR